MKSSAALPSMNLATLFPATLTLVEKLSAAQSIMLEEGSTDVTPRYSESTCQAAEAELLL